MHRSLSFVMGTFVFAHENNIFGIYQIYIFDVNTCMLYYKPVPQNQTVWGSEKQQPPKCFQEGELFILVLKYI